MKATLVLFFLLIINSFLASCQTSQTDSVKKVKHTKEEWEVFLKKFPTKKNQFLDSLKYYQNLKDTISIDLVNHFFWSDSISLKNKSKNGNLKYKVKVAPSLYKGSEFIFPCCGNASKEPFKILYDDNKECSTFSKVFPLAKIYLPNDNIMIMYSYVSGWEVFYRVTVEIINKNFEKTGHWGFLYNADWQHCDDTMYDIGKNPTPYCYPVKIRENGFEVIDEIIENEFKEEILQTISSIEINEKGQFEILRERKIYKEKEEIWSKNGFYISDKDGYANLRESPNNKSKIVEKVLNDTTLEIMDASKDWWQVKTPKNQVGYIHKSRIIEGL